MTKTPEELTEDWLNNKLQAGSFWFVETEDSNPKPMVVDVDGDFDDYNGNYYWPCFSKGKLKVLAPYNYDEYKAMQDQIADANKKVEELRGLLKDIKLFFEECKPHDFTVVADNMDFYLTRIKEVLK